MTARCSLLPTHSPTGGHDMAELPAVLDNQQFRDAQKMALNWSEIAKGYIVDNAEMAKAAGEDLLSIKAKIREVDDLRKELKQPSLDESRAIDDHFRAPLNFLSNAETTLKAAILKFQQAERKRIEEERR